ncbi:hypothetical protein, partial [Salinibacter altiplanensis]|uniref:hypothetical protein n=1 Tax=Salinibacter altiplanensis TaxID=1803181 RepID=UPI00131A4B55
MQKVPSQVIAQGLAALLALVGTLGGATPAWGQYEGRDRKDVERRCGIPVLSSHAIERAMRAQARKDYDIAASPNQGRFIAGVLFALAKRQRKQGGEGRSFLVRQEELFRAYLRATGLSPEDVPPGYRKGKNVGIAMSVAYGTDRVIDHVEGGPVPQQALSIRATWPETETLPSSYVYEDTTSDPEVRIRRERPTLYRLLKYPGFTVYDEMSGISVEPTTGALGALFDAIGMAEVEETRFAVAEDETQIAHTRVRKLFSVGSFATVTSPGRARKGIPDDRPRLEHLRAVLEQDLEVTYAGP